MTTEQDQDNDVPKTITLGELDLIFIRAQDADGHWGNVNVRDATDQQFGTWAQSRVEIQGDVDPVWSLEERAAFCDFLYQRGGLCLLKRRALADLESE